MNIDYKKWRNAGVWLTTSELALLTCTSTDYWAKLRGRGGKDSLTYTLIGNRPRYRREDVEAWLIARTVSSTSERGSK